MTDGGAAVYGLSSAHRYCPNVLLGGAVPVCAPASGGSGAGLLAFDGLLGTLAWPFLLATALPAPALVELVAWLPSACTQIHLCL